MPDQTNQNAQDGANQNNQATNETFDTWLEKADPKVKSMYEQHTSGLLNTVKATREERDAVKVQIKELAAKADKGSELEKSLTETMTKLEATERRANFVEEAVKPGIDCRNIKAAYALAVTLDAFDKKGNPQWDALKKEAPELFGKINPSTHGGNGDGNNVVTASMNDFIRRSAGH